MSLEGCVRNASQIISCLETALVSLKGFLCMLLFSISFHAQALSSNNADAYQTAMKAINDQRWESARRLLAQINEPSSQVLYMQLQVFIKLKRFQEANTSAKQLMEDEQWQDIAWFYNGLLAQSQGDLSLARQWYQKVIQMSPKSSLVKKSQRALKQISPIKPDTHLQLHAQFNQHYDQLHYQPSQATSSHSNDSGLASNVLIQARHDDHNLHGYYYSRQQSSDTTLDLQQAGLGYHYEQAGRGYWADYYQLNSDASRYGAYRLAIDSPLSVHWLSHWSGSFTVFDGNTGYDYLDGQRLFIEVEQALTPSAGLSLSIQKDQRQNQANLSYSPLMARISLLWQHRWNKQTYLSLDGWFEYRQWPHSDQRHAYSSGLMLDQHYVVNANVTVTFNASYEQWREYGLDAFQEDTLALSVGCRISLNPVTF